MGGRFTPAEDLSLSLSRDLNQALDSADPIATVEAALFSAENASF
jgi:hypothetical protein